MKIRADEHVSPKILRSLELVVLQSGWELSHVRDFHGPSTLEPTWIARFAADGGHAILSGDTSMLKRPNELRAIAESGLIIVVMKHPWQGRRRHEQAACLLFHWPQVEELLASAVGGDCIRIPYSFTKGGAEMKKVDYAKAIKSLATKPA